MKTDTVTIDNKQQQKQEDEVEEKKRDDNDNDNNIKQKENHQNEEKNNNMEVDNEELVEEEKEIEENKPPAIPQIHPLVAQLKQQIYQQRHLLDTLEVERSQCKIDIQSLQERVNQTKIKSQQRAEAQKQLEGNYHDYLKSMRATPDDLKSIKQKLKQLKAKIRELADELLEQADPLVATQALRIFWLNLRDCIETMGDPLPLHRVRMLTEKFIMDVLVENMNLNLFPGLSQMDAYNEMAGFFEKYDNEFSIRLRQEMALVIVKNKNIRGSDVSKEISVTNQHKWRFLYSGLVRAYPFIYQFDKQEPNFSQHFGAKVHNLVELSMEIGFAIKGQEMDIAAAETKEKVQSFDPLYMVDEDGQTSGIVEFCICPPFVVYGNNNIVLERGRVLCSNTTNSKPLNNDTNDTNNNVKTSFESEKNVSPNLNNNSSNTKTPSITSN
ncbi:unnamed protein product [Cunninghamella blakesleeana]